MIGKKVAKLLNEQITTELSSAYLYLSMAAQAESMNLKGLANWMYVQHQEEHAHAMHIFQYLINQGVDVELGAVEKPKNVWSSALEILKDTLEHEQFITGCFHKLMDVATEEKDYASMNFLQWYVTEQVEEEANDMDLIRKFEMASDNKGAMLFLDKELEARSFVPPFPVKATPAQLA